MYDSGDFIVSGLPFNTESWGPATAKYMDYIANDLKERQWNSIFSAVSSYSMQAAMEKAIRNAHPEDSNERVPLPSSDPPSPRDI